MKRYLSLLFILLTGLLRAEAFTLTILSDGKPVEGAQVTGYTQQMDSIASAVSDKRGEVTIENSEVEILNISASGLASRLLHLSDVPDGKVELAPATDLREVEVVASNKTSFLTHDSYRIPLADMKKYPSVFQALNEIPFINVLPGGELYYLGNQNIAILLNGVPSDRQEIAALAKDDILKIDIYKNPPPRFASSGVESVIDVITKSNLRGGNASVNIDQSPYPTFGENQLALFYNYGRNRFSATLRNFNKHYRRHRENSILSYEFDGVEYTKEKTGRNSRKDYDNNNLTLTYQNSLRDSYLYNLEVGGSLDRTNNNLRYDVKSNDRELFARNRLSLSSDNWYLRNYYEKQFGDRGDRGMLIANVRFNHFGTDYRSSYSEYLPDLLTAPVEDHLNKYRINYNALFGEVEYDMPQKNWGTLFFSVYGNAKSDRYSDAEAAFTQKTSLLGAQANYYGWIRKVLAYLAFGGNYLHQENKGLGTSYSSFSPRGVVRMTYYITRSLYLQLDYSYFFSTPDAGQLSETNQWLDNHLTFHGNPNLTPYWTHKTLLSAVYNHKYVNAALNLGYVSSPHRICTQYYLTDDFILETIENLKRYRNPYMQLSATVYPLGSRKWSFFNRIILGRISGKGAEYSWNSTRFQWNSSMSLMLGRWTLSASYQYPGRVAEGQLVRPRGEFWSIGALYRAGDDLFIGADIQMPFGKAFRESEYSVGTDLISQNTEYVLKDYANCVKIKLTWNVSFGRNQNRSNPKMDNNDNDTGVLKK